MAKDLTFSQVSRLEENRLNLKGVYYQKFPERYFPSSVRASHILGYVKEVDKQIRESLTNPSEYEFGDIIGWSGLEKSYEDYLKGSHGVQFYQVDAYGREVGYVDDFPPINPEPGRNIITTIDRGGAENQLMQMVTEQKKKSLDQVITHKLTCQ